MMPVNPPAASASSNTAGSQNRRRMFSRSVGRGPAIVRGEYDFNLEPGDFVAMDYSSFEMLIRRRNDDRLYGNRNGNRIVFLATTRTGRWPLHPNTRQGDGSPARITN